MAQKREPGEIGLKWQIAYALKGKGVKGPAKAIIRVLVDLADVGTGEIPAERAPSLVELAEASGFSESTVKRQLPGLVEAGWIARKRPNAVGRARHEPTLYWVKLPWMPIPEGAEGALGEPIRGLTVSPRNSAEGSERAPARAQSEPSYKETDRQIEKTSRRTAPQQPRGDVARLCVHLADAVSADGSRHPTVTPRWTEAAVRLLDVDRRPEAEIHAVIDWAQQHPHWGALTMSMPALYDKYDQVRKQKLGAERRAQAAGDTPTPSPPPMPAVRAELDLYTDRPGVADPDLAAQRAAQGRQAMRANPYTAPRPHLTSM